MAGFISEPQLKSHLLRPFLINYLSRHSIPIDSICYTTLIFLIAPAMMIRAYVYMSPVCLLLDKELLIVGTLTIQSPSISSTAVLSREMALSNTYWTWKDAISKKKLFFFFLLPNLCQEYCLLFAQPCSFYKPSNVSAVSPQLPGGIVSSSGSWLCTPGLLLHERSTGLSFLVKSGFSNFLLVPLYFLKEYFSFWIFFDYDTHSIW